MICNTCGSQNDPGVKFCTECGAPLDQAADVPYDAAAEQPALESQQPYGDPNQFGGQAQQPYGDPNQFGGQAQQSYGDPNQFGGQAQQTYGDPNQFGGQQYNAGFQPPPMNAAYGGMGVGLFPERSLGMAILLTIVTCGIYGLYWMYTLTEDSNKISGDPNPTSGGMVILLGIITCGIYSLFWIYKRGEIIDRFNMQRGLPDGNNAIIYLLLAVFGFGIVSYALLQNELNKIATGRL